MKKDFSSFEFALVCYGDRGDRGDRGILDVKISLLASFAEGE